MSPAPINAILAESIEEERQIEQEYALDTIRRDSAEARATLDRVNAQLDELEQRHG